jgi:ATP/maltotriose-dependent transcriptional regulator MalT
MTTPLLATKLQLPRLRAGRIRRPHLLERLNAGLDRPLTLISAPAGFGKTTLVAEWLADCPRPSIWLSLDDQDSDPARFLAYLTAALRQIEDEAGQATLAAFGSADPRPPLPVLMPQLVNEINAIPEEFLLVLDDYHLITTPAIHEAVAFLVEHPPACLHLVLVTRSDPPLPLARLRAHGLLNELRQADLRFTPAETGMLLEQALGGGLTSGQVDLLTERTEGWIAGLQMAVLALQELPTEAGPSRAGVESLIAAFSGTQRHVLDYLLEEVLNRLPGDVQSFLLQTSILERLCGPLCDALIGDPATPSQRMLEYLESNNLFLAPLDDRRDWYRYHRLFADLLRQRLKAGPLSDERPDMAVLHRRAAIWHEAHGLLAEAIRHTLAASDYPTAAAMIERAAPVAWKQGEVATLSQWLEALPKDVLSGRPLLSIYYATLLLFRTASPDHIEGFVELAARNDTQGRLAGEVLLLRGLVAMFRGDLPGSVAAAKEALQRLPGESVFRGLASRALSAAHLMAGEVSEAERLLEQDLVASEASGDRLGLSASLRRLGSLALYRGELNKARAHYQRALDVSRDASGRLWPVAGRVLTHLGELALEENRLEEAQAAAEQAADLLERFFPGWNSGTYVLLARLRYLFGDEEGAHEALQTALARASSTATRMDDLYTWVQATRLALARHDLASAERWASEWASCADAPDPLKGPDIETMVSSRIFGEIVQATLARLLLARAQPQEGLLILDRLEEASPDLGNRVEVHVLRALARDALGQREAAIEDLAVALRLGEQEGFMRMFLDEGEAIVPLLEEAARRGVVRGYAEMLLAAWREQSRPRPPAIVRPPGKPDSLIEPLTEREQEVLGLLSTSMTTPEIAAELGVAPSTVRTFVKNVYGKLGVHRRLEAIERAEELRLLLS